MQDPVSRRDLIKNTALVTGLAALGGVWTEGEARASRSPNEKLRVASIGCGGQGGSDLGSIASHAQVEVAALCDVDDARAAGAFNAHPGVPRYRDFRKMLEKEGSRIDAVHVSTPDHIHAVAAAMAMHMHKHVYVQKPLTHTISEARELQKLARRNRLVTQMGTQAHPSVLRSAEYLATGAFGNITEVHVQTDRPIWPQGMAAPTVEERVPDTLDWDLWLGPAEARPYNSAYLPFVWRGWWDFGTGALGDMACHLMDTPFSALGLQYPTSVEAVGEPLLPAAAPNWSVIQYQFPARGKRPAVKLTWYDGGKTIPPELLEGRPIDRGFNGTLFVGEKGKLFVPHAGEPEPFPKAQFEGFQPPAQTLHRAPNGHYHEWVDACLANKPGTTGSTFDYSCPMTESVLLGNVALRTGKKIEWDSRRMRAVGCPEADQYIRHHYRKGWSL